MIRIKQSVVNKLVKRLDENYQTMLDTNNEPFFREEAEMLYKEVLFRLALINLPVERDSEGKHHPIQPYARRVVFLAIEEKALEQINDIYTLSLTQESQKPLLETAIAKAKELGMEVELKPGGYDFKYQYRSIFDIVPPYVTKTHVQKTVGSQEKKG